ncbi:helix-turn-helix domain-containing protein [Anaerocolumna sp.]|uniref:helix-turn-helix domain-containing protein n=1 Tax=Anaerocolumna sp. TaxID=2041569 RepID=UPI0028A5EDD7|nr:helix-turn-helix transcriptional regulator [Anaerocolumna sp.]
MLCENLKKLREERGLTKKQMSDLIGIPYTTYVGYETLVREPKKEQVDKIAEALNVPSAYILGLTDARSYTGWDGIEVTTHEIDMILAFRKADEVDKRAIERILKIQ